MSKKAIQKYQSRALDAVRKRRSTVRTAISGAEIVLGAGVGGYVAETMPDIAGVPSDAAIGLVVLGLGIGMSQSDAMAIGTGMLAGYAHSKGRDLAANRGATKTA